MPIQIKTQIRLNAPYQLRSGERITEVGVLTTLNWNPSANGLSSTLIQKGSCPVSDITLVGLNGKDIISLKNSGFLNLKTYSQKGIKGIEETLKQHVTWVVNINNLLLDIS